jgi:GT2 family glycosyltransferase
MSEARLFGPSGPAQETPQGWIDHVANGVVEGWAINRGVDPAILFIFVDGKPVGDCVCSVDRPDLSGINMPGIKAGFSYRLPRAYLDGQPHEVSVRFQGGEHLSYRLSNGHLTTSIAFRAIPSDPVVQSCVDGLQRGAIRGWIVTEEPDTGRKLGGANIVVTFNNVEVARVKADKNRPDVALALDCDPNCGFEFTPPVRFRDGHRYEFQFHKVPERLELGNSPLVFEYPSEALKTKLAEFSASIETISTELWRMKREMRRLLVSDVLGLADYDVWARQYQKALKETRRHVLRPADGPRPLVSIICPVYRPRLLDFVAAVDSVLAQTYTNWELLLVDDNSKSKELTETIRKFCQRDKRIRAIALTKNGGISAATNAVLKIAKGQYIALFDHDDVLVDVAVEMMVEATQKTGAKLVYSDEDKIDDYGRFSEPNLKPDWNYRLMLSQNYVCHFLMVAASAMKQVGPMRVKYDGAQDHDLVLRLSEILDPSEIFHLPEVLYHWRKTPGSTATAIDAKSYAVTAGAAAVQDHLTRRGYTATVSAPLGVTTYQVAWQFKERPKVCVIIPFRDHIALTRRCVEALLKNTDYAALEIILVDNWSIDPDMEMLRADIANRKNIRIMTVQAPFNFSRLNNLAAQETSAKFLVFMNNDVFVEQRNWLRVLVDEALADEQVAAVGAKLVYPDRTIQHAGVILGVHGLGAHAYQGLSENDYGFMGRGICAQELSAVTAALMLCRTAAFRKVDGFDEQELAVAYNDLDLCLKFRQKGYRIIWTPVVVAEHHESASRGNDMNDANLARFVFEERTMFERWGDLVRKDPFYNHHFSTDDGPFNRLSTKFLEGVGNGMAL